jgi:hypothetical protein
MPLQSEYRIEVINSFQALTAALSQLQQQICLQDAHLPAWFQPPLEFEFVSDRFNRFNKEESDRTKAYRLIAQLEYLDSQKPREILVGAGLLAASNLTLNAILELNHCKDRFKSAILALKAAKIPVSDPFLAERFEKVLDKRPSATAHALRKIGLSRLHLKQCYRKIPFFHQRPHKVSWTWAHTRAITRVTVQQAEQLLRKQGNDAGIELQLNKLYSLKQSELLAIVQELAPHLRANLVMPNGESIKRLMVKGPVPLFYFAETAHTPLPHFRPPKAKQQRDQKRLIRSDVKLDPEPFLPAIRAHRYIA